MEASDLTLHSDQIRTEGYTVIANYLTGAELELARKKVDALFESEKSWATHNPYLRTPSHHMTHLLPLKDPFFLQLACRPLLLELAGDILGKNFILSCMNGFTTKPGGENQVLHLDQVESTPGTIVMLNALHVIDDFTKENGATRLIPGSHLVRHERHSADPALEKMAIQIEAPAGSLLVYSSGILHGGSKNQTQHVRRAIHTSYCSSWVKPEWDFRSSASRSFNRHLKKSEKKILGYYNRSNWYDGKGRILHAGLEKEPGFFWKQAWRDLQRFFG